MSYRLKEIAEHDGSKGIPVFIRIGATVEEKLYNYYIRVGIINDNEYNKTLYDNRFLFIKGTYEDLVKVITDGLGPENG